MKKNSYVYVCYGASLAIILAIAFLPFSNWAFRNHVDVLTGGWQKDNAFSPYRTQGVQIEPVRLTDDWTLSGQFKQRKQKGYPLDDTFDAYVQNARRHPTDPAALAHVIRQNFRAPYQVKNVQLIPPFWNGYDLHQVRAVSLWAAEQGAKIDPDNAYFTSSEAILLDRLGRGDAAYAALSKAGKASRYDEYAVDEQVDRSAAMTAVWGYRGEKVRAVYLGSILLAHWTGIRRYAKDLIARPATKENVQARADMLRVASAMERTDPYLMGILVAAGIGNIILIGPTQEKGERPDLNLAPRVAQFNALERKLGVSDPYDPSRLASYTPRLRAAAAEMNQTLYDPLEGFFSWQGTAPPPIMLLSVVASVVLAALMFKLKPSTDLPRRLLPYVGTITLMWLITELGPFSNFLTIGTPEFYWGSPPPDLSAMSAVATLVLTVLGLMQLWRPLQKASTILGIAAGVAGVLWTYPVPYIFLPPIGFFALLLLSKCRWQVPYGLIGLALIAAIGGMATVYVDLAFHGPGQISTALFIGAGCFATILFMGHGSRRLLPVLPAVTLLFAIGYLGAVVREMRQNQEVKVGLDAWSKEADLMRAKAGIN